MAVGIVAVLQLDRAGGACLLAGAALAVVTIAFNVPLNNRLAALDPAGLSAAEAAREWMAYYTPWTTWNHVRTVAPLVGATLLVTGIQLR